jgi:hypothetical protein
MQPSKNRSYGLLDYVVAASKLLTSSLLPRSENPTENQVLSGTKPKLILLPLVF